MNKKLVVILSSAVIFLAVAVLGFGITMSVNELCIEGTIYTDEAKNCIAEAQGKVDEKIGTNLLFVNEKEIRDIFAEYPYISLLSVEKKFPDTVVMKVEEKVEVYAVKTKDQSYCMIDKNGFVLAVSTENKNHIDGNKNTLLEGFTIVDAKRGEVLGKDRHVLFAGKENDEFFIRTLQTLDAFHQKVNGIRASVDKIVCSCPTLNAKSEELLFLTSEGVQISISNPSAYGEEKALAAAELYFSLPDVNKLFGRIDVVDDASGVNHVRCTYTSRA